MSRSPDPARALSAVLAVALASACALGCKGGPPEREVVSRFAGEASFYADSLEGRPTASGETLRQTALTAAHRDLPFGTDLRITRPDTGRSVLVRVNDRGPYADDRVLDLSRAAAERLDFVDDGHAHVEVEVLAPADGDG